MRVNELDKMLIFVMIATIVLGGYYLGMYVVNASKAIQLLIAYGLMFYSWIIAKVITSPKKDGKVH